MSVHADANTGVLSVLALSISPTRLMPVEVHPYRDPDEAWAVEEYDAISRGDAAWYPLPSITQGDVAASWYKRISSFEDADVRGEWSPASVRDAGFSDWYTRDACVLISHFQPSRIKDDKEGRCMYCGEDHWEDHRE